MTMEKKMSITTVSNAENPEDSPLKSRVFAFENGDLKLVRAPKISPESTLHKKLHERRRYQNTKREVLEFEPVRKEVCSAFNIPYDDKHVFILDDLQTKGDIPAEQRNFRAFSVILDKQNNEHFYAEGRTWHIKLNELMLKKIHEHKGEHVSINDISENKERWVTTKGFLSNDGFKDLEQFLQNNSFVFKDKEGNLYHTPENWFISGSSISSQ